MPIFIGLHFHQCLFVLFSLVFLYKPSVKQSLRDRYLQTVSPVHLPSKPSVKTFEVASTFSSNVSPKSVSSESSTKPTKGRIAAARAVFENAEPAVIGQDSSHDNKDRTEVVEFGTSKDMDRFADKDVPDATSNEKNTQPNEELHNGNINPDENKLENDMFSLEPKVESEVFHNSTSEESIESVPDEDIVSADKINSIAEQVVAFAIQTAVSKEMNSSGTKEGLVCENVEQCQIDQETVKTHNDSDAERNIHEQTFDEIGNSMENHEDSKETIEAESDKNLSLVNWHNGKSGDTSEESIDNEGEDLVDAYEKILCQAIEDEDISDMVELEEVPELPKSQIPDIIESSTKDIIDEDESLIEEKYALDELPMQIVGTSEGVCRQALLSWQTDGDYHVTASFSCHPLFWLMLF